MLKIDSATGYISLTSGNTLDLQTEPYIDADGTIVPIELGEEDKILFMVQSISGRQYLKRILTAENYVEVPDEENEGETKKVISFRLKPAETNLEPCKYYYALTYIPVDGSRQAYTYATGIFNILE